MQCELFRPGVSPSFFILQSFSLPKLTREAFQFNVIYFRKHGLGLINLIKIFYCHLKLLLLIKYTESVVPSLPHHKEERKDSIISNVIDYFSVQNKDNMNKVLPSSSCIPAVSLFFYCITLKSQAAW